MGFYGDKFHRFQLVISQKSTVVQHSLNIKNGGLIAQMMVFHSITTIHHYQ